MNLNLVSHPSVRLSHVARRVVVSLNGTILGESDHALLLHTNADGDAQIFVPHADIRKDVLYASDTRRWHPMCGVASYYAIVIDGAVWKDSAWHYMEPDPALIETTHHISFDPRFVAITLDGEPLMMNEAVIDPLPGWLSTDDDAIARKIDAGDGCALRLLYDRFHHAVYALAFRLSDRKDLSEDVTQQVFMEVFEHIGDWDKTRGHLSTWILTIARYTVIDALRRETNALRRRQIPLDDDMDRLPGEDASALDWETRAALATLVQSLPSHQLVLIDGAFMQGFTHNELAEQLHIPLGTVKGRIRQALQVLQSAWI